MWAVHTGPWWEPRILRVFKNREDAEKGRVVLAYELARKRAIDPLDEIGSCLDDLGVLELEPEKPPSDEEVLGILKDATTSAFEEGLAGALNNMLTLLDAVAELYDPDAILQKIAEGVKKYRGNSKHIPITSKALDDFIFEVADALGISEERVKKVLLPAIL